MRIHLPHLLKPYILEPLSFVLKAFPMYLLYYTVLCCTFKILIFLAHNHVKIYFLAYHLIHMFQRFKRIYFFVVPIRPFSKIKDCFPVKSACINIYFLRFRFKHIKILCAPYTQDFFKLRQYYIFIGKPLRTNSTYISMPYREDAITIA